MQTLWKFAQSLVHDGLHDSTVDHKVTNLSCTRCRLEDWAIAWDAAIQSRIKRCDSPFASLQAAGMEAKSVRGNMLGVPEERRRK